jgi:hypothetical protein
LAKTKANAAKKKKKELEAQAQAKKKAVSKKTGEVKAGATKEAEGIKEKLTGVFDKIFG